MNWPQHLQALHRLTGHVRFEFTHGVQVYVFRREGAWRGVFYRHGIMQHAALATMSVLAELLTPHADLELVDMGGWR